MSITPEHLEKLRAPFTPAAVKFRLDAKDAYNGKLRCVVYIDASLAADRINLVDPGWSSSYTTKGTAAEHCPIECQLTVLGVTRADVGQYAKASADDKHMKSAYSDALKRAAVAFGVGAYLRGMPPFYVTEAAAFKSNGKWAGIKELGLVQLRQQYTRFIGDMQLVSRFGAPIDHGDYVRTDGPVAVETEAMAEAAQAEQLTAEQVTILSAIAGTCGYPFDPADKLAEDYPSYVESFITYAAGKGSGIEAGDAPDVKAAALAADTAKVATLLGVDPATGEVAA